MGKTAHRDNFKFGKEPKKKEKYKIRDYYKGVTLKDFTEDDEDFDESDQD